MYLNVAKEVTSAALPSLKNKISKTPSSIYNCLNCGKTSKSNKRPLKLRYFKGSNMIRFKVILRFTLKEKIQEPSGESVFSV